MRARRRLSLGQKMSLAREAVDWIGELTLRRRPIPRPSFDSGPKEALIQMELHQNRLKYQAYDIAMALHQVFDLVSPLEGRKIPTEVKDPLARFLRAMRTGKLIHLRNAFAHYADYLAGKMSKGDKSKLIDPWPKHKALSLEDEGVFYRVSTKKHYLSMMQGFGAYFNDDGVTGVIVLGRVYMLLGALDRALELGPALSRWSGRTLLLRL